MRALIQRVSYARVLVNDEIVGEIARGILLFLLFKRAIPPLKSISYSTRCSPTESFLMLWGI